MAESETTNVQADPSDAHLRRCAQAAVETCLGQTAESVSRFAVGLSHYVFDVVTDSRDRIVVRVARPSRGSGLQGGLYWHGKLEGSGVPLPRLLGAGEVAGYPFAVYERLRGTDLEEIYSALPGTDRRRIAHRVAEIQRKVHTLPQARGYGHALSYDDPRLVRFAKWPEVLNDILDRAERDIVSTALCSTRYVAVTRAEIEDAEPYLAAVAPVAFLYDTNIRNVIVHNARISGIIDVDEVTFGDPLLSVGFTKTYMLLAGDDTEFVRHWCDWLDCTAEDSRLIDLYALVYAVRFMGTLGQKLNGNASRITDPRNVERLQEIADSLLASLSTSR
jgi:aminoglycoside phosphotransferase (APT) family kinase protein